MGGKHHGFSVEVLKSVGKMSAAPQNAFTLFSFFCAHVLCAGNVYNCSIIFCFPVSVDCEGLVLVFALPLPASFFPDERGLCAFSSD